MTILYRCLNDVCFGYCAEKKEGKPYYNAENVLICHVAGEGMCDKKYYQCKSYLQNTDVNPFRPELIKKAEK